jgi:hypothetical protein
VGRKLRWERQPVSQPERPTGNPSIMRSEMRRLMNMNDDPWAMGVLEPFLLLLCIALIGALLGWL